MTLFFPSFPRRREPISQPPRLMLRREMDPRLREDDDGG